MFCHLSSWMLCKLLQLHCGRYHFCCESLGTRQSHQQNFPQHRETPIGHPRRPRSGLSGRRKRQKFSKTGERAGKALPGFNSFHCHAINTAPKKLIGNRPVEETNKTRTTTWNLPGPSGTRDCIVYLAHPSPLLCGG